MIGDQILLRDAGLGMTSPAPCVDARAGCLTDKVAAGLPADGEILGQIGARGARGEAGAGKGEGGAVIHGDLQPIDRGQPRQRRDVGRLVPVDRDRDDAGVIARRVEHACQPRVIGLCGGDKILRGGIGPPGHIEREGRVAQLVREIVGRAGRREPRFRGAGGRNGDGQPDEAGHQ